MLILFLLPVPTVNRLNLYFYTTFVFVHTKRNTFTYMLKEQFVAPSWQKNIYLQ